jgi:hypothetical protein
MMTSDQKSVIPALIDYIRSDLFTFENLSKNVMLTTQNTKIIIDDKGRVTTSPVEISWEAVIQYLPLEFYRIIENYPNMYTIEEFDRNKYLRNPKKCAYDRYETTNMWRPLMILNRCPSITKFDFKFIRYYNITTFSKIISILIARSGNYG